MCFLDWQRWRRVCHVCMCVCVCCVRLHTRLDRCVQFVNVDSRYGCSKTTNKSLTDWKNMHARRQGTSSTERNIEWRDSLRYNHML